jgi:branched-chain amino acid transport system ATP-binding protein
MVAVLGPNGAGKTTVLLTLAGILPAIEGQVLLWGQRLPRNQPHFAARRGVCLVSDDRALFGGLTVRENLEVARRRGAPPVGDVLDLFPALAARIGLRARMLSGGEQQMLALARALIQQPRLLLLDEMSSGLAPLIVRDMFTTLDHIARDTGTAVIIVEQHVDLALAKADRAVVLVHGAVAFDGRADEARRNRDQLEAAYLGRLVEAPAT